MEPQATDVVSFSAPKSALVHLLTAARKLCGSRWHSEVVSLTANPQPVGWHSGKGGIVVGVEFGFAVTWTAKMNVSGHVKDGGDHFRLNIQDIIKAVESCHTEGDNDMIAVAYNDKGNVAVRDYSRVPVAA